MKKVNYTPKEWYDKTEQEEGSIIYARSMNNIEKGISTLATTVNQLIDHRPVDGEQGPQGDKGEDGLSAYELAVIDGFNGTLQQWLAAIKGEKGEPGEQGIQGPEGPQGEPGVDGKTPVLDQDIIVKGISIGGLKDGDLLPRDTTLTEFIQRLLVNQIKPEYTKPTLTLSSNKGLKFEIGSTINPTISTTYTKNDGGEISSYKLYRNDLIVKTDIGNYTEQIVINDEVQFRAVLNYSAGPVKNDNLDNPCHDGKIEAGTLNANLTLKPARAYWGFATDSDAIPGATGIREKAITNIDLKEGSTIRVVGNKSTRTIVFAYPETIRDCTKIRYEELGDDTNKTAFKQIKISIPDKSGNNPVRYRVYYYTSAEPFGATATFILTV